MKTFKKTGSLYRRFFFLILSFFSFTPHLWSQAGSNPAQNPTFTIRQMGGGPSNQIMEGESLLYAVMLSGTFEGVVLSIDTFSVSTSGSADFEVSPMVLSFTKPAGSAQKPVTHYFTVRAKTDHIVENPEVFSLHFSVDRSGYIVPASLPVSIVCTEKSVVEVSSAVCSAGGILEIQFKNHLEVPGGFAIRAIIPLNSLKTRQKNNTLVAHFKGKAGEVVTVTTVLKNNICKRQTTPVNVLLTLLFGDPSRIELPGHVVAVMLPHSQRNRVPDSFLRDQSTGDLLFFGDGALQSAVQEKTDLAANTGVGIRWVEHFPNQPSLSFGPFYRAELEASINIASTADSIVATYDDQGNISNSSLFGNALLIPKSARQSGDVRLTLYFRKSLLLGYLSGMGIRYNGANWNWIRNENVVINDTTTILRRFSDQSNTNMFRVFFFHDFINYDKRDEYSVALRVGYLHNWIGGDLAMENGLLRMKYLQSKQHINKGFELGVNFRLANLEADLGYSYLFSRNSKSYIPGLHKGRLVTSIRFVGGFKTDIPRNPPQP